MANLNKAQHWAELYQSALFEEDRDRLPLRLKEAHEAVRQRVHELWYSPDSIHIGTAKERQELEAAAYYLGLLESLENQRALAESPIVTDDPTIPGGAHSRAWYSST